MKDVVKSRTSFLLRTCIVGAFAHALLFVGCGCSTQRHSYVLAADNPELRLAADGIYFGDEKVATEDIVDTLEAAEIPKTRAIHILQDRNLRDLRAARALMALLARGGYTRSILVTRRHGDSANKSGRDYLGKDKDYAQPLYQRTE